MRGLKKKEKVLSHCGGRSREVRREKGEKENGITTQNISKLIKDARREKMASFFLYFATNR